MVKLNCSATCKICGNGFESYRSPKSLKDNGLPTYCSEKCRRIGSVQILYFSWDELSEEEKKERLKKSFDAKVIKKDGCWDWKGSKGPGGYVNIRYNRKKILAHRISWIIHNGEIPDCLFVCHKCDNRRCTNPDHLFVGTTQENTKDRDEKKRQIHGSRHHKSKLTESDVVEIKKRLVLGIPSKKIADEFGVTDGSIWFIKHGITWRHLN